MNVRRSVAASVGLAVAAFLVGIGFAPRLPDTMAIHWNAAGEADATTGKWLALAFLPALGLALVALLHGLPRVDPRRENYRAFRPRYNGFVVAFAAFVALVHLAVVATNLGYEVPLDAVVYVGVGGLLYCAGLLLADAEPNWFVGVRTPWTLSDDEVWAETHRLASRLFKLSGALAVLGAFAGRYGDVLVLGPVLVSAAVAVGYSYWLYANRDRGEGVAGAGS